MDIFNVRVPFVGEAVSVFKTVTDVFSYLGSENEKITRVSDDATTFSFPVTCGIFRLLLDGECVIVDRDFDTQVSLMTINSRDRGGKGKIDAHVRLFLDETIESSSVVCECEVTTKGMLARVNLPIEDVMSEHIKSTLTKIIKESEKSIVIDDFAEMNMDLVDLSTIAETSIIIDDSSRPLWVAILQFPASCLLFPFHILRRLVAGV